MKKRNIDAELYQGGRAPLMETLQKSWLRTGVVTPPNTKLDLQTFTVTTEEAALVVLTGCSDIIELTSQKPVLEYGQQNERTYTPDCTVKTSRGRSDVIEVKPLWVVDEEMLDYFGPIEAAYRAIGQTFLMWLAEDITSGFQFENWNTLRPYGRYTPSDAQKDQIFKRLHKSPARLGELLSLLPTDSDKCGAFGMLQRGEITFDPFQKISQHIFVSLVDSPFPKRTYENLIPRDWRRRVLELQDLGRRKKFRTLETIRGLMRSHSNTSFRE